MIEIHSGDSVVVGIDGSTAAVYAAHWAVGEAFARDVPLRLVSCVQGPQRSDRMTIEYARTCLRAAHAAIDDTAAQVKIETAVVVGDPTAVMISESRHAAMVCVGSVGIGRFAKALLGSTAAGVAEGADCPAAVVRSYAPSRRFPAGRSLSRSMTGKRTRTCWPRRSRRRNCVDGPFSRSACVRPRPG